MRIPTVAFTLGTTLALCSPGTFITAACAKPKVHHEPRRVFIVTPVNPAPYWDFISFHDIVIAPRMIGSIHAADP